MTFKTVLSASRRTDIPAFYMDWFMMQIQSGFFELVNPYTSKKTLIPATPDQVHTLVFWSKDFARFINGAYGEELIQAGYHLFFNFTVNSQSSLLEPNIPPLSDRLTQVETLCTKFGPETVQWRFDPICFYAFADGTIKNNLDDFQEIARRLASFGVKRCVTSFMDHYPKIKKRLSHLPGFAFIDPAMDEKLAVLLKMQSVLSSADITLFTCCEKEVIDSLPAGSGITPGSCIPNRHLVDLFGGSLSFKKDYGQRVQKGCGCMESKDIGLYNRQPCYHNCLFCYANPASDNKKGRP